MNAEMVPSPRRIALEEQHAENRRVALENLAAEAATADEKRAHEIMVQAAAIRDALKQLRAPFEETQAAGKASVCGARRVGVTLLGLSNVPVTIGVGKGKTPSERIRVATELGIHQNLRADLLRLAQVPDADFQRYIQREDIIPSVTGAVNTLRYANTPRGNPTLQGYHSTGTLTQRRRRAANIKTPRKPSLDEGYCCITAAIGHLSASANGSQKKKAAVSAAIDHLYQAEELLKPYRGGYVG